MSKEILTIENQYFTVKVKSLGAELTSMFSKVSKREIVWQGDETFPRQANNLFPICGPLKDGYYLHNGTKYEMRQHGLARLMEFEVAEHSATFLCFLLKSNEETKALYPYDFELYINFELIDDMLQQTYKVVNTSEKETMYYGVGGHTGFNIPMEENENSNDYFVEFGENQPHIMEMTETSCLTGEKISNQLENGKFNLSDTVFEKGSVAFGGFSKKELTLKSKKSNHFVKVKFDDFENCLLWCMEGKLKYLCIEPWNSLPDMYDTDHDLSKKVGILSLKSGKSASHIQEITAS